MKKNPKSQPAPVMLARQPAIEAEYLTKPMHLQTTKERYEFGQAMRVKCSREAHAEFVLDRPGREDPMDLLIASSHERIESLLPLRYGRMVASPFAFFRGAAVIMASDLSVTKATDYAVQSCGDSHLANFGAFATPERNIIFDINDFDETFPCSWEWDLKRLAASFAIASAHNGHKRSEGMAAAARVVECYRDKMDELSKMTCLDAWYSYLDYEDLIELTDDKVLKKRRKKVLKKALERDHAEEYVKLAAVIDGTPRIKDQPPLIFHEEGAGTPEYKARMMPQIEKYRETLSVERRILFDRYEFVDNALKVVGVGSVGTVCGIALFFASEEDPLFLQVKEARRSVLEPYSHFVNHESHGARVVTGQRLMQAATDVFLGHYVGASGKHFYVRQLRDVKVKPMIEIFNHNNMLGFARNCGWALARAHARSGDPAVIAGYIGKGNVLPKAIAQFADAYREQNLLDHGKLLQAIKEGRIEAEMV
ncbi:MAG: DUF2252 domain-containing protein [Candidatus Obscuribacterales bacterium]